tara:strand:- start:753 stop:1130 length:378 start_codon:yes stop_codon:yes gene_type:complete
MEYLKNDSEILKKKISRKINDYNYSFLNQFDLYFDTEIYSKFLNSLITYKLKNIWNHIILKWIQMDLQMKDNKEYKSSIYSKQKYNYIHTMMSPEELNQQLINFIQKDKFKGLFVINCIQDYILN